MHILIVEDSELQRNLLQQQLIGLGYTVSVAADGEHAWELIQRDQIPIVVTDWVMPVLDGPGLIQRIRAAPLQGYTYVVLLTSKDQRGDIVAGLEGGADDYLIKPCDPHELRARLAIGARIVDLEARLRQARDTDELTGLRNRRAMTRAADTELVRGQRERTMLGVALLDIDNFKRINDTYGHLAGDHALQFVASVAQQSIRPYDMLGRWGGEEFLMMLVNTTLEETCTVAERVRQAIATTPLNLAGNGSIYVTVSIGVASCERNGNRSLEQLVQDADQALYRAKAAGRDCIRTAHERAPSTMPRLLQSSLA